jgi:ribosomal subunit interface protein
MKAEKLIDKIQVIGHGIDTGESFQEYVRNHIEENTLKYWNNVNKVRVFAKKTRHLFEVEIIMDLNNNPKPFIGEYSDSNIYTAFNQSFEKCEKQMRRMKRKVKDDHR